MNKRLIFLLSSGALLFLFLLSLCLGSSRLSLVELYRSWRLEGASPVQHIFLYVRLPRALGAVLAGAGLSVSGAILQAVLGNPLASPNVIGVNAGAGFFVLAAAVLLPGATVAAPAAFTGAMLVSLLVLGLSARACFSPGMVVLVGFGVSSLFTAGINAVLLLYPDAYIGSGRFLTGGLSGLLPADLLLPGLFITAGCITALLASRAMNILSLGPEAAGSLGMRVTVCRITLLAIAALLAGSAVSFGGMLGFVGLVAPHCARLLTGGDNRCVIPLSALLGAGLVTLCDLLSRVLFAPYELPVGILLSLLGGPFFLWLIFSRKGDG